MTKRLRLGDILIEQGVLSDEQLKLALKEQKKTGKKLGKIFIGLGFLTEEKLMQVLSKQVNIPVADLANLSINQELAKTLPEAYARKFRAIIIGEDDGELTIAMNDPLDLNAIDELKIRLKKPLKFVLVSEFSLVNALDIVYRKSEEISALAEELQEEFSQDDMVTEFDPDQAKVDAPVVRFLRSVFEDAVKAGASDIHIEPDKEVLRIRLRVFGSLQEQIFKEKEIMPAVSLRLKLIAGLNISENRVPQDGRFSIKVGERIIDVRFSSLPTQHGESLVMRLLDQGAVELDIEKLAMPEYQFIKLKKLIHEPNGVLLVTGPTGSGKSTTLYSVLSALNSSDRKIITVEDPVEYQLPRISQVQVNEKVGLTFSRALRTILRQDPDIVLVGEMRDEETAEIAIRAALTGHLVLSTLHTNDAASTALRLLDMNIEGFLISATLQGILAQRLVKKICQDCAKPYEPTTTEKNWIESRLGKPLEASKLQKGVGCSYCNRSGYSGRLPVFELLTLDDAMSDAMREEDTQKFMDLARADLKGRLLADNALALALKGETTLSEVFELAGEGYVNYADV